MIASLADRWRLPGCGPRCWRDSHDAVPHEAHGYLLGRLAPPRAVTHTGALVVDLTADQVWVRGQIVTPSSTEWAILTLLAAHIGETCSQTTILLNVWGAEWIGEHHLLRVMVGRLRGRLREAGDLIETVTGRGYRLRAQDPILTDLEAPLPRPWGGWARDWDCCRDCGRTSVPHAAYGRCDRCRLRYRRGCSEVTI